MDEARIRHEEDVVALGWDPDDGPGGPAAALLAAIESRHSEDSEWVAAATRRYFTGM